MEKYVAYYRVSTVKQGRSGLGIEAQRRAVSDATKNCTDCVIAEFEEHESGKNNDRPKLLAALKICSDTGATLVIAKLDRLSRNAAFILSITEKANDPKRPFRILFCDYPNITRTMLGMLSIFAEHEREIMSKRQIETYESKRQRGLKIGYGEAFTPEVRAKGIEARKEKISTDKHVVNAKITIRKEIEAAQSQNRTLEQKNIVNELNRQQVKTYKGNDYKIDNVRPMIRAVMTEMNLTKLPTGKKVPIPRTKHKEKNDTKAAKDVATKLRDKGESLQQIAAKLNEIGLQTANYKAFQATTVMRLLGTKKA